MSPDYFHGEELNTFRSKPDFDLTQWIKKFKKTVKDENNNDVDRTSLLLNEWMAKVKEMYGSSETTYAIVGKHMILCVDRISNIFSRQAFALALLTLWSIVSQGFHTGDWLRGTLTGTFMHQVLPTRSVQVWLWLTALSL